MALEGTIDGTIGFGEDALGGRSDVLARMRDILSRRGVPSSERLAEKFSRLLERVEGAVSPARLRQAAQDLFESLRRCDASASDATVEAELDAFYARIIAYRESESIQHYEEYLFTVDVQL